MPVHRNNADRPVPLYAVVVPSMELIGTSSSQYQRQLGYVMTSIDSLLSFIGGGLRNSQIDTVGLGNGVCQ
jgi:hypothetical protein